MLHSPNGARPIAADFAYSLPINRIHCVNFNFSSRSFRLESVENAMKKTAHMELVRIEIKQGHKMIFIRLTHLGRAH